MSTIKVTNIDPPSVGGAVNVNGLGYPNAGPLSNRNIIINGGMTVAQRNTQVTGVTTGDYRTCDRFRFGVSSLGTWTVDQDTNAPDGFSNSFKLTCTTANASPGSTATVGPQVFIEAQDLQSLAYGTTGAKTATLSFWVKSNKTGNATVEFLQPDNSNKLLSPQYSISSADTWEYKTISIPADTAGVINNDNDRGLQITWWINTGSDLTSGSHQTTWSTFDTANRNPSNLGVGGATSDYYQITGVQLELGDQATPFEHRSYGDELARCQRYYQVLVDASDNSTTSVGNGGYYSSSNCRCNISFMTAMRAIPDVEVAASGNDTYVIFRNASNDTCHPPSASTESLYSCELNFNSGVSGTAGHAAFIRTNDNACKIAVEAEL